MKNWLLLLASVSLVLSCAKQRPIDDIPDPDNKVLSKNVLLGNTYLSRATVVKVSENAGGPLFVGAQSQTYAGFFEFTEEKLKYYNAQTLYSNPSANKEQSLINEWSVKHYSKRLDDIDGKVTNREVEDDEANWSDKAFFKVDWSKADISESSTLPTLAFRSACWKKKATYLIQNSLEMSDDYVTWVLGVDFERDLERCWISGQRAANLDTTFTAQIRYSFKKRVETGYKPYVYKGFNDPLINRYGFFRSIMNKLDSKPNLLDRDPETGAVKNPVGGLVKPIILMNRWRVGPSAEKTAVHHYYYAKDFPQEWKWLYPDIFMKTNKLLAKHNVHMRFQVCENTQLECSYDKNGDGIDDVTLMKVAATRNGPAKNLGDIRYSMINFITEQDPSAPFGYGPSDADPFTGEIFNGSVSVWTGYLQWYMFRLADSWGRSEKSHPEYKWKGDLFEKMGDLLGSKNHKDWTTSLSHRSKLGKTYFGLLPSTTFAYPGWASFSQSTAQTYTGTEHSIGTGYDFVQEMKDLAKAGKIPGFSSEQNAKAIQKTTQVLSNRLDGRISSLEKVQKYFNDVRGDEIKLFDDAKQHVKHHLHQQFNPMMSRSNWSVYPIDQAIADGASLIGRGITAQQAVDILMYRVAIHEFGHTISLRHNFYGSVDKNNDVGDKLLSEQPKRAAMYYDRADGTFKPIKERKWNKETGKFEETNNIVYQVKSSSSVMDYVTLQDEALDGMDWEAYDKAAIVFAYTADSGDASQAIDLGKLQNRDFLFCTDEHRIFNALCNAFDHGTSPSEVALSLVEQYDELYRIRNFRSARGYWNTNGYAGSIFGTMLDMKKFIPMRWRVFSGEKVHDYFRASKSTLSTNDRNYVHGKLVDESRQALRIAMAFYQSVLQTSQAEKNYESEYDSITGEKTRQGIIWDKIFAMMMLMGDDAFGYDPTMPMSYWSFLDLYDDLELKPMVERVFRASVVERVDMKPWFLSFGRALYAAQASNAYNDNDRNLSDRIKFTRLNKTDFVEKVLSRSNKKGKEPSDADRIVMAESNDHFVKGEEVAYVEIHGNYFVAGKDNNLYSYTLLEKIDGQKQNSSNIDKPRKFVLELYQLYRRSLGDFYPQID